MKRKLLLLSVLFGIYIPANSQVLQTENFNALTVGNIGTSVAGNVAGQAGFYTYVQTGGANSDFQIVNEGGARAKVAQITGPAAATVAANVRYLLKDGLADAWTARTAGNNIIQFEYSFFTGAPTTSTSLCRATINTASTSLGGFTFQNDTKVLQGWAYGDFNSTGTPGNYNVPLKTGGLILPANTWIKVGFAYNATTGQMNWACNDVTPAINGYLMSLPGLVPDELDFIVMGGTANTIASSFKIDDYTLKATATLSLLSVNQVVNVENKFTVYPNPVNNIVNISNSENLQINKVSITDINGRTVKTLNFDGVPEAQINVSDLNTGIYFMTIDTNEGIATKKIIKN